MVSDSCPFISLYQARVRCLSCFFLRRQVSIYYWRILARRNFWLLNSYFLIFVQICRIMIKKDRYDFDWKIGTDLIINIVVWAGSLISVSQIRHPFHFEEHMDWVCLDVTWKHCSVLQIAPEREGEDDQVQALPERTTNYEFSYNTKSIG